MDIRGTPLACALAIFVHGCSAASMAPNRRAAAAERGMPATEPEVLAKGHEGSGTASATDAAGQSGTEQPAPDMPSSGAFIFFDVKDYDAWKSAFDVGVQRRKDASAVGHGILRERQPGRGVIVWLPVSDPRKATLMLEQSFSQDASLSAAVRGKPVVYVMHTVAAQGDPEAKDLSAAIVRLRVTDFARFQSAFEGDAERRKNAGVVGYGVGQDLDDAKLVYLYLQSRDPELLESYLTAKVTRRAWKRAGVTGRVKTTFVSEGEQVLYP